MGRGGLRWAWDEVRGAGEASAVVWSANETRGVRSGKSSLGSGLQRGEGTGAPGRGLGRVLARVVGLVPVP